jgi:class 3 adenylate cyclase
MKNTFSEFLLGKKVGTARVVPLSTKILLVFVIFILASNFVSNYINLVLNQGELIQSMKQLLIKDLKEIYLFCNNQREIYEFNKNMDMAVSNIETRSLNTFKNKKSVLFGIRPDGTFMFQGSKIEKASIFEDQNALQAMIASGTNISTEGALNFSFHGESYLGIYKYNPKWGVYLVRAEEMNEFNEPSQQIFLNIALIIAIITLVSMIVGVFIIQRLTHFIGQITNSIMAMSDNQQLDFVDIKKAPNDDITFLGMAFNSLSTTINNLLLIFRKFVNKDIVRKAYDEKEVRLEGKQLELTMLFTDIKSFTYITETLGTDIIKLLNIHYDRAIREIVNLDGIIGSIIGDALLAVYGVIDEMQMNKSLKAVLSGYKIQEVAEMLRLEMHKRKEEIIRTKGALTELEEKVYKAVLLEVGVGIDGGLVFYGNIGSYVRMTNTVIGDNVNAASRLEGLTRVYKVPVICSKYVKDEIEKTSSKFGITFVELDTVQVKGKTEGVTVYWPIPQDRMTKEIQDNIKIFSDALKDYYKGDWVKANEKFVKVDLALAEVFKDRTQKKIPPSNWSGIWTMTTK